ncbi:hypothetical protein PNV01_10570 [Turicibacter sanguinis]|uniref:hypothetical protein n=1 Tax=Turicibacter sanguinis TaxID=154288 RepID=UPI00232F285F|nr:hypothetical protein [Turicibacter sanguinis]MDB8545253.1 hypothetical protein [Turicibacter sanguinis]
MKTDNETLKTNNHNKRSKEELRIHRETMKNYFIANRHKKIEFKDIKRDLYKHLDVTDRTIRSDLEAIEVSAFNGKFYKLDKIDEIDKCIKSIHDILQQITLYSPLLEAKGLDYTRKYPELETTNIFMVLVTSNSNQALLDFQNYLKLYFKLIGVNFEEKFFEIQYSPRFIKFYLTLKDDCNALVDMLYYFKHAPLKEIWTSPEIKTFLDEDITKTLKKLCSSKSNESSEKNTD